MTISVFDLVMALLTAFFGGALVAWIAAGFLLSPHVNYNSQSKQKG